MVLRYVCLPSVAAGYKMLDELVMLCKFASASFQPNLKIGRAHV